MLDDMKAVSAFDVAISDRRYRTRLNDHITR
jgi:hypothetical protein